jgi:selenocysteine-specific elongation factor
MEVATTRLVLGVIGHVDHGKTALVRALTGQDTDRLPEEKRRGISIALGFASLRVGSDTGIDLIDMPGHERFVRTMVSGATGMDAVVLVVAANEGLKPQTIEHVHIASLLGVRRAVVAISKTDLASGEESARAAQEAVRLLARCGVRAVGIALTSVREETGIEALRDTLRNLAQSQRLAEGTVFLPIDRSFNIVGHGPVVTGTLRGAAISVGDTLELLPLSRRVRVRAVQVHGASVAAAEPGQRVALNLRDVELADLERGMVLAAPDTLALFGRLTMAVRAVEGSPPLKNGMRLRALLGTCELEVRLRLLSGRVLEAGQAGFAQLQCERPVALPAGEHCVLRLPSPAQTVAGGRILETGARRERRGCPQLLRRLEDLRTLPPVALFAAELRRAGQGGTTLRHLSQLSSLAIPVVVDYLRTLPVIITRSGLVVGKVELEKLLEQIPVFLAAHPDGLSREQLLPSLTQTSPAVLDEALARLRLHGTVAERGRLLLLPRPDAERARARSEADRASEIAENLRRAGLRPPDPAAIVVDSGSKRAVERLLREGVVVRALDRAKGREILFHRDTIQTAQRHLAPLLERPPGLLVTEIGVALGISRKYSMPLLDYLDTIHFTCRINDRRVRAVPTGSRGGPGTQRLDRSSQFSCP